MELFPILFHSLVRTIFLVWFIALIAAIESCSLWNSHSYCQMLANADIEYLNLFQCLSIRGLTYY